MMYWLRFIKAKQSLAELWLYVSIFVEEFMDDLKLKITQVYCL